MGNPWKFTKVILSDISSWNGEDEESDILEDDVEDGDEAQPSAVPPASKWQKLAVPYREARHKTGEEHCKRQQKVLVDNEHLIASKHDVFAAGNNGLQAYRACAIQSCLWMMLKKSQGFSADWGGRMVHSWVRRWIDTWELPSSNRGCHAKVYSLLDDPEVCTELHSYLRSNKWSMDPQKLSEFTKQKMIPEEANKYLQKVVDEEMPQGLKQYVELELFPRIQLKASWIWQGEQPLKKKGLGRGLHQSDFICSTIGWLKDASQTLEYGKNYDGYWNGELFVKQLKEKFFPAFKKAHGPGYQALVMVDNSQGHSAYAEDALLTTWMNLHPGGEQAKLQDG
ncbi:hypothetical protein M422DRAFT_257275 [Sphaerobolus stellatus SS14]|uniref:DDE-1 domain-containing protein n=1 Tax=Sphaerobolus stellatus (strain SS14) TaxID=990650 RepID=A0A0C9VQ33_SPHS4|nr:hypothetical protein M422DRAFT_257275 [Sphaerobolus stellatus SS14]